MKRVRKKKDIDFIFASSSINVRENRSRLHETIARVRAAESYADAMKIFSESGLDDGSGDYMSSLDAQSRELYAFLREVTDTNSEPIIAFMNAEQTVLGLKTAIKAFSFGGTLLADDAQSAEYAAMAAKGDFSPLGMPILEEACREALTTSLESRDPQTVDIILDKALYRCRGEIAASSGIEYLETVFKNDVDVKNLCTAFRLKRRSVLPDDIEGLFFDGGEIERGTLVQLASGGDAAQGLAKTQFGSLALELCGSEASPLECERALEDVFYSGLAKVKDDIFGSGKVVAYAILYEKWLCDLRILLTEKKVGRAV